MKKNSLLTFWASLPSPPPARLRSFPPVVSFEDLFLYLVRPRIPWPIKKVFFAASPLLPLPWRACPSPSMRTSENPPPGTSRPRDCVVLLFPPLPPFFSASASRQSLALQSDTTCRGRSKIATVQRLVFFLQFHLLLVSAARRCPSKLLVDFSRRASFIRVTNTFMPDGTLWPSPLPPPPLSPVLALARLFVPF